MVHSSQKNRRNTSGAASHNSNLMLDVSAHIGGLTLSLRRWSLSIQWTIVVRCKQAARVNAVCLMIFPRKIIAQNIAKHKRHIVSVFPRCEEDGPGFAYTIGNQERALPELLIIGFWGNPIAGLLNELSNKMIERGRSFEGGEL